MKLFCAAIVIAALAAPSSAYAGWGAIAYNPVTGKSTEVHGQTKLSKALNGALDSCGSKCLLVTWEQDVCIALATNGHSHWGDGFNLPTRAAAIAAAIADCGAGCTWRVWACS
ncbi:MAG: DUF4189 domain-containing protein [Bradyrhizobium sp.]|nr:MAG: DUF4189 domain-containing protein [Bradyrhizobium sp.]